MEYARDSQMQNTALGQKPLPELGRLKSASERIAAAVNQVNYFVDRFHGARPEAASASQPTDDNYRNNLASLFEQIERLEAAAQSLDTIG